VNPQQIEQMEFKPKAAFALDLAPQLNARQRTTVLDICNSWHMMYLTVSLEGAVGSVQNAVSK